MPNSPNENRVPLGRIKPMMAWIRIQLSPPRSTFQSLGRDFSLQVSRGNVDAGQLEDARRVLRSKLRRVARTQAHAQ